MTTSPISKKNTRSWTERPEEPRNRIGGMVFFGLSAFVLTSAFVWYYLFPPVPPRSYVATLSIQEYGVVVPKIRLGQWDAEAMTKVNGIFPWEVIGGQPNGQPRASNLQNQFDIEQFISDYKTNSQLNPTKDTAVVQMRCHAAVTNQGDKGWSCGLYIDDDPITNKPYPFQEFLEQIKSVPAKNIVIFAEIADLQFEPHLGWVVNPIEQYIRKACQEVNWNGQTTGRKVWIVCSQADYQSPFYSVKRSKTLFQEACEQSIRDEAARVDRGNSLSLGRYFELIYRYCHTASAGLQTPRLILANQSDDELPPANDVFLLAYQNRTATTNSSNDSSDKSKTGAGAPSGSPSKESSAKEDSAKSADYQRRKLLFPVSFRQNDAKPQSQEQADGTAKPGPESATTRIPDKEQDPWLRIWQLRDEIESRGTINQNTRNQIAKESNPPEGTRWSPRDFAPLAWRKLQAELASASIWAPPIGPSDPSAADRIEEQVKALEELSKALAAGSIAVVDKDSQGLHWDVLKAWNDFRSSDKNHRKKWQDDATGNINSSIGLVGNELDVWQSQRTEYRRYIACLSDLSLWIDLAANLASAKMESPKFQTECNELLESLLTQKQNLPTEASQSALEKSASLRLEEAVKLRTSLQELLADTIRRNKLVGAKESLTWVHERKYQVLLSSPLLTYQQRVDLVRSLKERTVKEVVPETNQDFKTIHPPSTSLQAEELRRRCEQLMKSWKLFSEQPLTNAATNELEKLLVWGQEYSNKVADLFSSGLSSATEEASKAPGVWHFQSLVEPTFATKLSPDQLPFDRAFAGIVVSPIPLKTLRLEFNTAFLNFQDGKTDVPLRITIKHFDDSDVPTCDLKWTTGPDFQGLKLSYNGKPIQAGQSFSTQPKQKEIELKCSLPVDVIPPSRGAVNIRAVAGGKDLGSAELNVPVFRDADRIDLIARRTATNEPLKQKRGNSDGSGAFVELDSPAIKGAQSQFSFALSNKQTKARSAEVKVYATPSLDPLITLDTNNLISVVKLELPAMQETPLKLELADPKRPLNQLETEDALQSMLVFEVTEYEILDPKKDGKPKKLKGPWRYWARFKPTKPEMYLDYKTSKVELQTRCFIEFTAKNLVWDQFGSQELKIDIQQQTLSGNEVTRKTVTPIVLKPDNPSGLVNGPIIEKDTQRFLADIGGYPRAIVLDAIPDLIEMKPWSDDRVEIVDFHLLLAQSKPDPEKKNGPEVSKVKDQIVVPNLFNGETVVIQAIECNTIVDRGPNSSISYAIFKMEGKSEKLFLGPYDLPSDRSFTSKLSLQEDGNLAVGFEPGELKIRLKDGIQDLEGDYLLRIQVGELKAEKWLTFDKTRPEKAFVDAQGAKKAQSRLSGEQAKMEIELFQDDKKVEVWIDAKDASGLGIKTAEFAISKDRNPSTFSDDGSFGKPPVTLLGDGRVSVQLDAAVFMNRTKGEYWMVAKTVDWAGNIQSDNYPLKIIWKGAERPAAPK